MLRHFPWTHRVGGAIVFAFLAIALLIPSHPGVSETLLRSLPASPTSAQVVTQASGHVDAAQTSCPVVGVCGTLSGYASPTRSSITGVNVSTEWTNLTPNLGPSPLGRQSPALTYDVADGYMLLFGGFNGSDPYVRLNDTWIFQDGRWNELHPKLSPPWLVDAGMAYDYSDQSVILFGGQEWASISQDYDSGQTWAYHAGVWTNLTSRLTTAPGPREAPSVASDPVDQGVYLFGGLSPAGATLNDTWVFHADSWSRLSETVAPPRVYLPEFAYSRSAGGCVLFGGFLNSSGPAQNQTWLLSNGTWINITTPASPEPRGRGAMAGYDSAGDLVLFGGEETVPGLYYLVNSTWVFQNRTWLNVSERFHPIVGDGESFASDPSDGYALMFGGVVNPPGSRGFGCFCNETWVFGPALLAKPFATPNPVDLGGGVAFDDPYNNASSPYNYSWQLGDGNTTTLQSFSHTYDHVGIYSVTLSAHDAFGHYNNSSVEVVVNPPPTLALVVAPNATDVGVPVQLTARLANGSAPFQYDWNLGDGNRSNNASVAHAYAQPGNYSVSVNVTDSNGILRQATASIRVSPRPSVSLAVGPALLDVSEALDVTATVSNGTAPFTYLYSGLPDGCVSQNASVFACPPSAPGNYTIHLELVDTVGVSAVATSSLVTVDPLPAIDLQASRYVLDLGQSVSLAATIKSSGAGGLTFTYLGLPPGCTASSSATHLTCTPTQPGSFEMSVNATDRTGATASAAPVALTVNGRLGVAWNGSTSQVLVGAALDLEVTVLGGTLPVTVSYFGLPLGCASANTTSLSCHPNTTGNYTTYVRVTDATGASVVSSWNVSVVAGPTSASSQPPPLWLYAVGVGALAAAVVAVVAVARRLQRRRGPPGTPDRGDTAMKPLDTM